jgi:predicted SAM-dependent methyltransferase
MDRPSGDAHTLPDHRFVREAYALLPSKSRRGDHNRLQVYEDIHTRRTLGEVRANLYENYFIKRAFTKLAQ